MVKNEKVQQEERKGLDIQASKVDEIVQVVFKDN